MTDRTVTLHIDDWMRIKLAANQGGAQTPAIDDLIRGDEQRPTLARPYEWWAKLHGLVAKSAPKLAYVMQLQFSVSHDHKSPPKPEKHEVEYCTRYWEQQDDRELPEMDETK